MQIKLEYGQLEFEASRLKNQEEVFGECINEMERVIDSLQSSWEGRAAVAYAEQFERLKPSFEQTKNLINSIYLQIKQTMLEMQEKDEEIASRIKL